MRARRAALQPEWMAEGDPAVETKRRSAIAVGAWLLALAAVGALVVVARDALLLGFLALLLASALSYPVDLFSRVMPRSLATLLTLLLLLGAIAGVLVLAVPVIATQLE